MTKETLPYPQGSRNPPSAIPPQPPLSSLVSPNAVGKGIGRGGNNQVRSKMERKPNILRTSVYFPTHHIPPLRSPMRPLLLLLPEPRLPKRSKSHSQLERGRNSNTNYLIQFALQLHYLPPAPCCSDYLQSMDAHCYGGESSRGGGRPWRRWQGQGQLGHVRYF